MNILVACEFSDTVGAAFRKKGHQVLSCDLLPSEGTGEHYQGNVFDVIDDGWDMMIAFPPCTFLTTTANRSFLNNPGRWKNRLDSMMFVYELMNVGIEKICIENPVGVISSHIRKPDQYIHPFEFGHPVSKKTCLWLKNLPPLVLDPCLKVDPEWVYPKSGGKRMSKFHHDSQGDSKSRSRTFQGIADAMANQWG